MRDRLLRAIVLAGVVLVGVTELLSAFGALRRGLLIVIWLLAAVWLVFRRPPRWSFPKPDPIVVGIVAVLIATGITAVFSPPNSADAMAYHMPRVVYWAEQASVRFFPTPYLNQIMLQPFAEYCMLHVYLLFGGDGAVNLVQWLASIGSIVAVSSIAAQFGLNPRAQAFAALFCATLPSGVLASSGAKNDYVLAMWLVCAVYFAARAETLYFGAALGLALLTKGTAYLFAPFILAAFAVKRPRILVALPLALLINTPMYVRNVQLSGSPLGFDSAQGDGVFRWRNEAFGWRPTLSNLLRHASEQTGRRSEAWNRGVYEWVSRAHRALGININDSATTWRDSSYAPPKNANHEADAPNFWHLLLLTGAATVLILRRDWPALFYAAGLLAAAVAFCGYLKWQPFMARLFLPLLVASSPLAGYLARGRWWVTAALCLLLLDQAKHPALDNWTRPLRGPNSVLHRPRADQYFADMSQWGNAATYRATVRELMAQPCGVIGLDITNLQLEYPLQALLRAERPATQFVHTGVTNASARYSPPIAASPCAVVCLDCVGDERRLAAYQDFARRIDVDRFAIFLR